MIQIEISERANIVTVSVAGELSTITAKEFDSAFEKYLVSGCKVLALDLKKMPYLDSFGISRLMKLSQGLKSANVEFIIINLNEHIRQIFHMGTFDKIFNIMSGDDFESRFFPHGDSGIKNITRTITKNNDRKGTKTVQYKYNDKTGTTLLFEEEDVKDNAE